MKPTDETGKAEGTLFSRMKNAANEVGKHFSGKNPLLLAAAAGLLLVVLSGLWPESTAKEYTPVPEQPESAAAYEARLEQRLAALLAEVEGAGRVAVMLTLESGEETIYALDTQSWEAQFRQTHILLEDGSALAEMICLPQIRGAAVVCDGGGDPGVAARLTELTCTLLGLPAHRVCVQKRAG